MGKGHALGASFSRPVDYVLGGWQLSSIYTYTSGAPLDLFLEPHRSGFGEATQPAGRGEAIGSIPPDLRLPPVSRGAPIPGTSTGWYGPNFRNMDFSLAKRIAVTERVGIQLRLEAFNALNGMNWSNPNLTVTASDFGKTNTQLSGYYGRQIQYSARLPVFSGNLTAARRDRYLAHDRTFRSSAEFRIKDSSRASRFRLGVRDAGSRPLECRYRKGHAAYKFTPSHVTLNRLLQERLN